MNDNIKIFVFIFLSVNISVLMIFFIAKFYSNLKSKIRQNKVNHFGDNAENKVIKYIEANLPNARILKDLYLKTETGLTEIDVLLLSDKGIFIIEIKSHNGYIITKGKHWTQRWGDKVVRFYNPTYQNKIHKSALESILKKRQTLASLPIYTVTVFTSSKVSFSENVKDVIRLPLLVKFINSKPRDKRMTRRTISELDRIIKNYRETSIRKQKQHKRRIYENNNRKKAYRVNRYSVK